jgi:homoserine dehydrogenase
LKRYNLCLLGCGNVGRALLKLLVEKTTELRSAYDVEWRITGVSTRRMGHLTRLEGIAPDALLADPPGFASTPSPSAVTIKEWLEKAQADVLFESTSLNPENGEPATGYLRDALEQNVHVVTANKGPVAFAFDELQALALAKNKRFLFESTVMDGAPIFSLFREALPAVHLSCFSGILNSTTNFILGEIEAGNSFEEAVKKAQAIGIAETDPSMDIDGWDAAVKVSVLTTVLMGVPLRPSEVQREGIRTIGEDAVRRARAEAKPYKLVCRAERTPGGVTASVRPEQVPATNPLASITGTSSVVHFETDSLPGLTVTEHNPGPRTTAYGMLADFITIARRS